MSPWLTITLTLTLVGVASVSGQGKVPYDWQTAPYGNDDFNVRVHYAEDTFLECNDSRVANTVYTVKKWITPELEIIENSESIEFDTLDGTAGWYASVDGYFLNITLTQDRHFGIYYCLLEDATGKEWVVKTALNYKGAYWGNVWYRYEQATIWGIVGSVICGAIFAIGAVIWTRFEDKVEDLPPEEDDFDTILAKLGYDNEAFAAEEEEGYTGSSVPNEKPSSDMQIRETASEAASSPPTDKTYEGMVTSVEPQTYTSLVTATPPRSDSPTDTNNEPPAPYETVVEINGSAKAVDPQAQSQKNQDHEKVHMVNLQTNLNKDLEKSVEDIRL